MSYAWLIFCFFALSSCGNQGEENRIKEKKMQSYEQAFNKRDSKALSAHWSQNASFVIPELGQIVQGREAIDNRYHMFLSQHPNAKLEIKNQTISFPNDHEAVDAATAIIKEDGYTIEQNSYKVFLEKQNGEWLITELRQVASMGPPKSSPHLKEIEWLVGNWIDSDEDVTIHSNFQWDRYQNFLINTFSLTLEGTFQVEGKQIIGWDPIAKRIRSWIFDSDGSFGEAYWKKHGNHWVIETASTLPNGRRASSINIITPIDKDKYTWHSVGRAVGGQILPDIEPVTVTREEKGKS